jgi:hypothetical protein
MAASTSTPSAFVALVNDRMICVCRTEEVAKKYCEDYYKRNFMRYESEPKFEWKDHGCGPVCSIPNTLTRPVLLEVREHVVLDD